LCKNISDVFVERGFSSIPAPPEVFIFDGMLRRAPVRKEAALYRGLPVVQVQNAEILKLLAIHDVLS